VSRPRDSSGGYLTGNEAWSVFDNEDDDDPLIDDEEPEKPDEETVWARKLEIRTELDRLVEMAERSHDALRFDPSDLDPDEIGRRIDGLADEEDDLDSNGYGDPPADWSPVPTGTRPTSAVVARTVSQTPQQILGAGLTAEEFRLWEWLERGEAQTAIAAWLGITQGAVSQREARLRKRVDEIYVQATGRSYHWTPISTGGRPRRR